MIMRVRRWSSNVALRASAAVCAALMQPAQATAQTVSISSSTPDLGTVVSAPTGITVFRVASSSGSISRISGNGVRLSTTSSRALVTVTCNTTSCRTTTLSIRVGSIGSPSGRAGSLTNFTVTAGTATISNVSGTNPLSFNMGGLPVGSSATFWIGADVPIRGNDSASATGNAASGFYVYAAVSPNTPTSGSTSGLAIARVFRPITVSNSSGLAFGKIARPSSGSGTVAINATTGARTVTGTGAVGLSSPAPTRAAYTVSGEGGQAFSLTVPASFQMTGPGTALTVSLTSTARGSQVLSSSLGSAGSFSFGVGGSFSLSSSTVPGTYQGSYSVTVQYN